MQAFSNVSSVKAQAILDGLSDGGPVKVDDLIEAMEEYATGASPKMLIDTKLDEALRDIMGEVKTHFGSFADENGKMDFTRFEDLVKEGLFFLGEDMPGDDHLEKAFRALAGVDDLIGKDEVGAFVDIDDDDRFSIGQMTQTCWTRSRPTVFPLRPERVIPTIRRATDGTDASNGTDARRRRQRDRDPTPMPYTGGVSPNSAYRIRIAHHPELHGA